MHEKNLFEYAVIRIVPQVEREEFLNVGVVVFCKRKRFLRVKWKLDANRLNCFSPDIDIETIGENLKAFEQISLGLKSGGPMALEDVPERFRWLTAVRSSVIQTSRPHPGICDDLETVLEKLFKDLVAH